MSNLLSIIGVSALLICALAGFVLCRSVTLLTRQAGALFLELQHFRQMVDFLMRTMAAGAPKPPMKAPDSDNRE